MYQARARVALQRLNRGRFKVGISYVQALAEGTQGTTAGKVARAS
jgi:hypothetical protein